MQVPFGRPQKGKKRKKRKAKEAGNAQDGTATRRGAGFRLYDLGPTCATLLLLADVPAKIVSGRLGHSSITVTLDPYSHVLPAMQKRAADTLGKLLGAPEKRDTRGG